MSRKTSSKSPRPRLYVCTAQTLITVHGAGPQGVGKVLTAGAQVDFDEVVGHGPDGPVTLEQALGAHAQTFFTPATMPASAPMAQDSEE